jgi:phospholipid/cholesterol/gamma-HCH transport system permease protein
VGIKNQIQHLSPLSWPFAVPGVLFMRSHTGQLMGIVLKSLHMFFTGDLRTIYLDLREIVQRTYRMGVTSLPLVFAIGTVLGVVVIVNALTVTSKADFGNSFGPIMVIVVMRELGPILTGFLVAGRSGSSFTTYLGNMKVNSEIEALQTLGVSPLRFLVMPAIVGAMLALLIANFVFVVSAILSGFAVSKLAATVAASFVSVRLEWSTFSASIFAALSPIDFVMFFVKPALFAAIIAANAIYYTNLCVHNDAREVPEATSRSVVSSFMYIIFTDLFLSLFYIGEYLQRVTSLI